MQYKKKLLDIVNILAGYTFRKALQVEEMGDTLVIQAKDIADSLLINEEKLVKIDHSKYKTKAFVKNNDVIISVRGKFRAGVYKEKSKNIIASSSVYILRLLDNKIKPEYLAIYLNSVVGQKEIKKALTGTIIKTILRKDLENLNIIIPEIKKQESIINLYKNNITIENKLNIKKQLINDIAENAISKILNK